MGTRLTDGCARRRRPSRRAAVVPAGVLLVLVVGCGGNRVVPEQGATLLHITTDVPSATPAPDELRVWAYDDVGRLWDGARVPETGALGMASAGSYGTLLVQPGVIHGALRLHVRALASGARVMDGVVSIAEAMRGKDAIELRLSAASLPDGDGDDVPDVIDDCLTVANPAQGGCAGVFPPADAGVAGDADGGAVDGDPGDAPRSDASERDSAGADATAADANPGADASPGTDARAADASPGTDATSADASPGTDARAADASPGTDATGTADGRADACADACVTPPPKAIGERCTGAGQCASGFCTDGVCCMSACGAPCQSCSTGACLPVKQGKDVPECTGSMTCNKKGECLGG